MSPRPQRPDPGPPTTPRVTVLVPVYNAAGTLAEALESIQRQTLRDFEALIVLNGCSDGSVAIAEDFGRRDTRFFPIVLEDKGLVPALNLGFERARAQIVARLDADDLMAPERLERQLDALDAHPDWVAVSCGVSYAPLDGVPPGPGMARYVDWLNGLRDPEDIALARFIDAPLCQPAVTARRDAVRAAGGYRVGNFPEDHELWLRLLGGGARIGSIPDVLVTWRDRPDRLTRADPRFAHPRRREIVHRYLVAGPLDEGRRPCRIWGAGRAGRRHAKGLVAAGARVDDLIDIDPKKIGRRVAGGIEVTAADALCPPDGRLLLIAVAARGARDIIGGRLRELGYVEGADFLAVR